MGDTTVFRIARCKKHVGVIAKDTRCHYHLDSLRTHLKTSAITGGYRVKEKHISAMKSGKATAPVDVVHLVYSLQVKYLGACPVEN